MYWTGAMRLQGTQMRTGRITLVLRKTIDWKLCVERAHERIALNLRQYRGRSNLRYPCVALY